MWQLWEAWSVWEVLIVWEVWEDRILKKNILLITEFDIIYN
ncbi:hypothetical protein [Okeania sp. SIO3I5]|nr:hypothetical protein [Okeania sp. SIO3I5]